MSLSLQRIRLSSEMGRWLLGVVVALLPALISMLLLMSRQVNLNDFTPIWSDEIFNWHQAATFRVAGFNGGYYTVYEMPPPAEFTRFYTYGPWLSIFYGLIGRVVGWQFTTYLIVNVTLFTGAMIFFCRAARLDTRQLLLTGVLLSTFWGFLVYYFTGMQESVHQTLAVLLAAVFFRAFEARERLGWGWRIGGILLIGLAGLLRISWVILFLPFLLLTLPKKWYSLLIAAGISAVLGYALLFIAGQTGAPGNNSVFTVLGGFERSLDEGFRVVGRAIWGNIQRFLNSTKPALDLTQSVQLMVLFAGSLLVYVGWWLRPRDSRSMSTPAECLFHLYNIGTIWIAAMALYIIATWGDFRLFAAHMMLSFLLLIAHRRFSLLLVMIAISLLAITSVWQVFDVFVTEKFRPTASIAQPVWDEFRQAADLIVFDPDVITPWCNTLYFSAQFFDGGLLNTVPAGIGLSFFLDVNGGSPPIRSQYLLIDGSEYERVMQGPYPVDLELMAATPRGNLYRNRSAGCEP